MRLARLEPWIALAAGVVFLLAALGAGTAAAEELEFTDRTEELRFRQLASELRCLVCQNQSLEDSHASLANDLKKEVLSQIRRGSSDEQIVDYLVGRYGDFVRYRPPMKPGTWLLWLGPVLLLMVGGVVAWTVVRRHGQAADRLSGNPGPVPSTVVPATMPAATRPKAARSQAR